MNDKLALPFGSTTANFGPGCVGFQVPFRRLEGLPPLTRLVGDYRPTAAYSFPAYLTVPLESRGLTSVVCMLVSTSDDAFILLTPTRHRLSPDGQAHPGAKEVLFPLTGGSPGVYGAEAMAGHGRGRPGAARLHRSVGNSCVRFARYRTIQLPRKDSNLRPAD